MYLNSKNVMKLLLVVLLSVFAVDAKSQYYIGLNEKELKDTLPKEFAIYKSYINDGTDNTSYNWVDAENLCTYIVYFKNNISWLTVVIPMFNSDIDKFKAKFNKLGVFSNNKWTIKDNGVHTVLN